MSIKIHVQQCSGSSQDGGIGKNTSLPRTTKRRITTNLKNKQPELPENQIPWNSNNQGVTETFIQTSRREERGSWAERKHSKAAAGGLGGRGGAG